LTSAVQLIPKLWPFLSHSIRSVRRAALRTVSVLLATGRLKVSEFRQLLTKYHVFEETTVVTHVSDNRLLLCCSSASILYIIN